MTAARKRFFLNDELHEHVAINRGKDLMWARNFKTGRLMTYSYTDARKRMQPAFKTPQVAKMLNRNPIVIARAIANGDIEPPQYTYDLYKNNADVKKIYFWGEKDILALLDYLATVHYGRPRKDGLVSPKHLPTPRELRAMIRNEETMYIKQGDQFIPTWRAKEIG